MRAVLVADLDSFTASTLEHGITSFLVLLHEVHRMARPVVQDLGGVMLRSQADTLFCLFDTVEQAVTAARAFHARLADPPIHLLPGRPVTMAIGIGYGPLLNIEDEDALGSEVNLAYKLGEDIGTARETLLTEAALAQLPKEGLRFETRCEQVSGLDLHFFALV